ncbi:hypothetical protein TNCT_24331 [Trichonephila clavata]|uniref:Uncharacterized protein n=1 Tax=Trichonephila clavata TaxID=2740835 RepID=A0A8X6FMC6_TRICU|nr:hypothetical protein TNCT_24331 [Trichonephila clavata]
MDALKLRRTPLRRAFTKAVNHLQEVAEYNEQIKLSQDTYNTEFEAIEGYAEKLISWQVRFKNLMKTDASGQKDNHSLVTSLS